MWFGRCVDDVFINVHLIVKHHLFDIPAGFHSYFHTVLKQSDWKLGVTISRQEQSKFIVNFWVTHKFYYLF